MKKIFVFRYEVDTGNTFAVEDTQYVYIDIAHVFDKEQFVNKVTPLFKDTNLQDSIDFPPELVHSSDFTTRISGLINA